MVFHGLYVKRTKDQTCCSSSPKDARPLKKLTTGPPKSWRWMVQLMFWISVGSDYLASKMLPSMKPTENWGPLQVWRFRTWKPPLLGGELLGSVHPGKSTWNLIITQLKRRLIFQTSIFWFHVNLHGCNFQCFFLATKMLKSPTTQGPQYSLFHLVGMVPLPISCRRCS